MARFCIPIDPVREKLNAESIAIQHNPKYARKDDTLERLTQDKPRKATHKELRRALAYVHTIERRQAAFATNKEWLPRGSGVARMNGGRRIKQVSAR